MLFRKHNLLASCSSLWTGSDTLLSAWQEYLKLSRSVWLYCWIKQCRLYPRRALKPILKPDILLVSSCASESIWCYREGSCSVRGAPCGRPALLEQATLTLPLKSVPAALSTSRAAARPFASLEFHSKFFLSLRNQNLSWQASVWPEKFWQGPVFDTQELKELKTSASMYLYVWTVFPWLFLVLYLFFVFVDVWTRTLPGNWLVFSELRKLHATTSSRGNQKH